MDLPCWGGIGPLLAKGQLAIDIIVFFSCSVGIFFPLNIIYYNIHVYIIKIIIMDFLHK